MFNKDKAYEPTQITLYMDDLILLSVIGNLQLSLRHPENKGPSSHLTREFISQVTPILARINPEYLSLIEAGWKDPL